MSPERVGAARPKMKHWLILSAISLLLAAILLPPLINIGRYQHEIANSLSAGIGRRVRFSQVELRLLPRPGFELSDFRIEDDPAFSNEPLLRAPSVVAYVRLLSLWKGRLDIDRISLDEANLNVVRNADGRMNLGVLLLKASQTPSTPTSEPGITVGPRFPYISATNSRINFKDGNDKLPFSFLNADLSVWLDHPDEWRMKFEAQPARTDLDLDLADTGTVRLEGSFRRAAQLHMVPLQIRGEWNKAQLGQVSRLLIGKDTGWRGAMSLETTISGTGEQAQISTRFRGNDVHRTEFEPVTPLDFDASCTAQYQHTQHALRNIACNSPIGKGRLRVSGSVEGLWDQLRPTAHVEMASIPAEATVDLLRSTRSDFASDLKVSGSISGALDYATAEGSDHPTLEGTLSAEGIQFVGGALKAPIALPNLTLTGTSTTLPGATQETSALALQPFAFDMGDTQPVKIGGQIAGSGFSLQINGSAKIDKLLEYSKAFGLSKDAISKNLQGGTANLALTIHGPWVAPTMDPDQPVASDLVDGSVNLKGVKLTAAFLANTLEINQAKAIFEGDHVSWQQADVEYGSLHATGGLSYTFPCMDPECQINFQVRFASLDAEAAQASLLGAKHRGTLLKELLGRSDKSRAPWPQMEGSIDAQALKMDRLALKDAHAELSISGDTVSVKSLDARAFGGDVHVTGTIKTDGEKPVYTLQSSFNHANPAEAGELFHQKWGTGQLNLTTNINMTGFTEDDLTASTKGDFHWEWNKGSFQPQGTGNALNRFDQWIAKGTIDKSTITLGQSNVKRGKQAQPMTGTITLSSQPKFALGAESH